MKTVCKNHKRFRNLLVFCLLFLLLFSGAVVRAPKPKTKALRGGERELFRNPDRLLLISGAVVRAPKPKTKALRGGEREPQAG